MRRRSGGFVKLQCWSCGWRRAHERAVGELLCCRMKGRGSKVEDGQDARCTSAAATARMPVLPNVPISADDPFVGGEVHGAHWAAGVEFVGGDADFSAQSIFAAVGEACAGV